MTARALCDFTAARAALLVRRDELLAELRDIEAAIGRTNNEEREAKARGRALSKGTTERRVLDALRSFGPMTARTIARQLSGPRSVDITPVLASMVAYGLIVRCVDTEPHVYVLPEVDT